MIPLERDAEGVIGDNGIDLENRLGNIFEKDNVYRFERNSKKDLEKSKEENVNSAVENHTVHYRVPMMSECQLVNYESLALQRNEKCQTSKTKNSTLGRIENPNEDANTLRMIAEDSTLGTEIEYSVSKSNEESHISENRTLTSSSIENNASTRIEEQIHYLQERIPFKLDRLSTESDINPGLHNIRHNCRRLLQENELIFHAMKKTQENIQSLENQYLSLSNHIFKNQQKYLEDIFCVKEHSKIKPEWKIFSRSSSALNTRLKLNSDSFRLSSRSSIENKLTACYSKTHVPTTSSQSLNASPDSPYIDFNRRLRLPHCLQEIDHSDDVRWKKRRKIG